jgi:hypothetical protein
MENVQKHKNYINMPSKHTFISYGILFASSGLNKYGNEKTGLFLYMLLAFASAVFLGS